MKPTCKQIFFSAELFKLGQAAAISWKEFPTLYPVTSACDSVRVNLELLVQHYNIHRVLVSWVYTWRQILIFANCSVSSSLSCRTRKSFPSLSLRIRVKFRHSLGSIWNRTAIDTIFEEPFLVCSLFLTSFEIRINLSGLFQNRNENYRRKVLKLFLSWVLIRWHR